MKLKSYLGLALAGALSLNGCAASQKRLSPEEISAIQGTTHNLLKQLGAEQEGPQPDGSEIVCLASESGNEFATKTSTEIDAIYRLAARTCQLHTTTVNNGASVEVNERTSLSGGDREDNTVSAPSSNDRTVFCTKSIFRSQPICN
jgi:hypothetical protein